MAAETEDITYIKDEDVLRRLWQSTEDFARKKEIRARMYKLREQRLKEFYTTGEVLSDVQSVTPEVYLSGQKPEVAQIITKHSDNSSMALADSIEDQGFLALKTKEIRDSKSPTRDFQVTQEGGDNSAQSHWKMESSSESYRAVGSGEQYEVTSQSQRSSMAGENDQVISNVTSSTGTHSIMNRNEAENVFADGKGRSLISYNSDNVMSLAEADSTARTVTGRVVSSHQSSVQSQKWGTTSTSKSTSSRVTSSTYGTESTMRDISDKIAGDTWVEEGTDGVTTTVRHVKKVENLGDQGGVMKITRVIETSGSSADYIHDNDSSGVSTVTVTKTTTTKGGGGARNVVEMRIMPSNEEYLTENDSGKTQKVITKLIKTSGLRSNENVDDSAGSTVVTEKIVKTARRSSDDIMKESSSVCTRQESRTHTVDRTIESSDDFHVAQDVQVQEMKKSVRNDQITGKLISDEEKIRTVDVERNEFETISEDGVGKTIIGKETTVKPALKRDVVEGTYLVKEERGFTEVDTKTKKGVLNINQREVIQGSDHKKPGKSCRPEETQERQPETVLQKELGPKEPRKIQKGDTLQITRERGENERFKIAEKTETTDTAKTTSVRELSRDSIPSFDKCSVEDASSERAPCEYIDKAKAAPDHVIPEKKEGSYTTTYQWSFTPQKINIEVSASHAAFASSLRAPSLSPERASSPFRSTSDTTYTCGLRSPTKSISRSSLDRTTPTPKKSFTTEPQKTLRTSPTKSSKSPTNDRDKKPKAKTAPVMIVQQTVEKTSKEARLPTKDKRKLPGTKKRSGTPGVSPSTSPERDVHKSGRIRTTSSSSESSRQTYTRNVEKTKKESYCETTNFLVRERSPNVQENGFTPIRPDHQRKSRNIKSSSSSPSTSPERKSNKSTHGQNSTLKTKGFHEQNKKAQLMHRGKTNLITPDGRNLGPESTETPEKRRIVKKPTANEIPYLNSHKEKFRSTGKEEKQYRNPERKPDLKKRDSKEDGELKDYIITPEGNRQQRKPGSKPRNEPDDHYVTPDGREVTGRPGSQLGDEPEDHRFTPEGNRQPQRPGSKPGDEPDDHYVTPAGRKVPRKPGSKPRNEPDDHYVTPDGREVTGRPGSQPGDEPEDHRFTPEGNRQPQKPGSKSRDEPDDHYVTPDGRKVPRKPGSKPGDEPEDHRFTPEGNRQPQRPGSKPGDEPDDHYVTPDGRKVPRKPGSKPRNEPDDHYVTPDGREVTGRPGSKPGDEPEDHRFTPEGNRQPQRPGSKPGDEPDDHYVTPAGRKVPRKPGSKPRNEPDDHYVTPDGREVTGRPGSQPGDEPEDHRFTPEGNRQPQRPGSKPGDEPDDHYVTPAGRKVPRKPGSKPRNEPDDHYVTPDGREVTGRPGSQPGDEPEDHRFTPEGNRQPQKPGSKSRDEPDDHYVTPDGRKVPRKPGSKPGDEPEDHRFTPEGNRQPQRPGSKPGDEPDDHYVTPDGRKVPRKPGSKPRNEPDDHYVTPDGREVTGRPGSKPGDEPEDHRFTPEGNRQPQRPGSKPGDEPDDHYVTPAGRKVPRKPGSKPRNEPDDHYVTPDGREVTGRPGSQPGDEPEDHRFTPEGNRQPQRPGSKPGDEPDDHYVTPAGRKVPRKPGSKPRNEPDDHYVTPDGREVTGRPGSQPGDEPEDHRFTPEGNRQPQKPGSKSRDELDDHYVTPDGRKVPRKPGSKPRNEPDDHYVTPDGREVTGRPGSQLGDEPEDHRFTPEGNRQPQRPGSKPGDEPDDHYVTPAGRKVPRKPGSKPRNEPDDHYVTPDGREVTGRPGSKPGDEPEDHRFTPEGNRQPQRPGSKPGDEPDDHYVTPAGRKVPRKPGSKPRNEPDDHYVTPDGREVTGRPGSQPGDEPEDHRFTPEGNRQPQKPGSKPRDELDDHYVTPDGRKVPRKPGSKPRNEPDDHYVTPDGREVTGRPGSQPGDEPEDHRFTPEGNRQPQRPGSKPGDEPDDHYVTPAGRKVPRKPGSKPRNEPDDHYVTPDGREVTGRPGSQPGDEPEDHRFTPEGNRQPQKPGSKSRDEPDDHYVTPDGRKVPRKPGSKPGDEPEDHRFTPEGNRQPQRSGSKPRDEPDDHYVTADGREVPTKSGDHSGNEQQDYIRTPDGCRTQRKPISYGTDDADILTDVRNAPQKTENYDEEKSDDEVITVDGRRVFRHEQNINQYYNKYDFRSIQGDSGDTDVDYYIAPGDHKGGYKPNSESEEEHEHYNTSDDRNLPAEPGRLKTSDAPSNKITPDGRRVTKKPETWIGEERLERNRIQESRNLPRKPEIKPVGGESDRRNPSKPVTRKPVREALPKNGFVDMKRYAANNPCGKSADGKKVQGNKVKPGNYVSPYSKRPTEKSREIRNESQYHINTIDTEESKKFRKEISHEYPDGRRVPTRDPRKGEQDIPHEEYNAPGGRRALDKKPEITKPEKDAITREPVRNPHCEEGSGKYSATAGAKSVRRPQSECVTQDGRRVPGKKSGVNLNEHWVPGTKPETKGIEPKYLSNRLPRTPVHNYVTPDGRPVAGKKLIGKSTSAQTYGKPNNSPLCTTNNSLPKRPEPSYATPTKASLMKKPTDTSKSNNVRGKMSPTDDVTRRTLKMSNYDESPRVRSTSDFINTERDTEIRQYSLFTNENDEEQPNDYEDCYEPLKHKTTSTSGPISGSSAEPRKVPPQHKSQPKKQRPFGQTPKLKTQGTPLRTKVVDSKSKPTPEHSANRPKKPIEKDGKKTKCTTSESSEAENDDLQVEDTRYGEKQHREYKISQERSKVKNTFNNRLREPVGVIEYPDSPRGSSPETQPRFTQVNNRLEELIPRYPDSVTEPEDESDEESQPRKFRNKQEALREEDEPNVQQRKAKTSEQDEPEEEEEVDQIVSVAQRVNKFMDAARKAGSSPLPSRPEDITLKGLDDTINSYIENNEMDEDLDSVNAVKKAKTMFENIANSQVNTSDRRELLRHEDIVSRPSVFDRRGKSPEKQVPETNRDRRPVEPEALRKENLLKLGIRCPEDILNRDLFQKTELGDTFPRRKTPSPERPTGKFDTYPSRKYSVKDDRDSVSPKRGLSPEKGDSYVPKVMAKAVTNSSELQPNNDDVPFVRQNPAKSSNIMSYPFSDKPKVNGYTRPEQRQKLSIPKDSDLKTPSLLKEPRKGSNQKATKPEEPSRSPRAESPKKIYPEKDKPRTEKAQNVRNQSEDREPARRRPSGKVYAEEKSPERRMSPNSRFPYDSRASPSRGQQDNGSPTAIRTSGYPDTRRSSSPKKNFEEIIPSERQDEKMYPHDRGAHSPTSKRPDSPRRDYPHDKTATGRRPSGRDYPGDIGPYRGSPERNYQHDKATTRRRLSGKEHSETENTDQKSLNHPGEKPTSLRRTSTGGVSPAPYYQTPLAGDISHDQTNERPRDESPRTHDVQVSKFGVSLRRTSTSNSIMKKLFADVGRKESELDRIFDLEILESLLEQAKGYDERRGIRQQIRIVKKMIENKELSEQPVRRKSTQADYDDPAEPIVGRQNPSLRTCGNSAPDRRSPEKILPGKFETGSTRRQSEELSTVTNVRRHSSEQFTTVRLTGLRKMTDIIDKSPEIKSPQIVNKAVKKSYADDEMKEESLTDSITSSYGIGPTDEKGMPLFGLKALRRQNKSTPEVQPDFTPYAEEQSPRDIKDSSGRPLFGLKALQISKSSTVNCEENQTSESSDKTLKDLVNRHDKHARGNAVSQPQQRTPSRLRDTFAQNRDEDFIRKESDAEEVNHSTKDRGQSLRAMIQKHESLTESDRRPETVATSSSFSSSAIIRSSAIRKPDGGISVKSNVILGETTSRDGEKPKSRVRTAEYSYETPKDGVDDYGTEEERLVVDGGIVTRKNTKVVSSRSNTTESILSRTSRKSLSPERKSPDGESIGRTTKRPISDKLSHLSRKFSNEPEGTGKRPSGPEPHYSSHTKSSLLHSNTYTSSSAGADRHSSTRYGDDDTSSRRRSATPQNDTSINRRRSSTPLDELKESLFRKSSTAHDESDTSSTVFTRYGRGGAVKALSQKFQQGGAEAESSKTTSSYPKAGLILRSASFKHTNGDLTPPDSPAYKQSVSLEARVGSPTATRLGRDEKEGRESRRWSHDEESECNEYDDNRRIISKTVIETTESKSFLGNSSKVTGVQDIISRMKAADLEDVGFESPEDVQARSLLNKFLGASVMMSGMEPLVKASGNSSATLVSQVERQRILQSPATETIGQINIIKDNLADFDNIDNIWDERKLRQLLDACTDYEGRRKIRARLRTVMAEKSACEDVVAAAQEEENLKPGDGSKTVQAGESLLPYLVEQLRTSLILESRPGQKSEEGTSVMHMEDSGTESGEDLRLLVGLRDSICDGKDVKKTEQLNKKLLTEVQDALQKLQTSLNSGTDNALDPVTRDTLLQLVTRLQSSLKLAPGICSEPKPANRARFANRRLSRQNRHTVGVTHEELADARRLIQESSLTGGGNFIDTGQQAKTDKPGSQQPGISYAVVKQNSADDVTSKAPFKLFRPIHFNQGKLKASGQFGNSAAKPFLSSKQIESADEWVRNQIGNTRRLSDSCAIPCSDPTYFSLEEHSRDNCERNSVAMGSDKSSQLKKLKSPSPPYKNIQYAPSVFNQYEPRNPNLSIFTDDKKSLDPSYSQVHINDDKTRSHSPVKPSVSSGNGDSLLEYDPSLSLFTPEQSVKIAVHKAAINKQLSREEEKRIRKLSAESDIGSTEDEAMEDDGDISSNTEDEDEHTVQKGKKNYPNAQSNHQSHHSQDQSQNRFVEKVDVNHTDKRRNSVSVSDDSKKVTTEESMNRFEKRIQEIQNEKKTENRQKIRSIEELQKIYNSRKEKERKNNADTRSQMIQNVQAKYQKNLGDHVTNQKTYNPQRLNPDIRSKYEKEIKKNMENDVRSKPIWNEYDDRRRKESLRGLEYMTSLERSGLLEAPMDASLTESEVSISSTSTENSISHAQRLLRLATGEKSGKHSTKKVKMKRANTIDIPKPLNYYDVDDFSDYTDDEQKRDCCTSAEKFMKPTIPPLEPRTESDKKFLALLRQQNHPKLSNTIWMKEQEPSSRNLFAEHQWGNRFSRIKTSFENVVGKKEIPSRNHPVSSAITGARAFWKSADDSAAILKSHKDSLAAADRPKLTRQGSQFLKKLFQQKETEQKSTRLPWTNQENVVVGMLTLSPQKPDNKINKANQFSHAPMSAFRPVERKVDPAKMFNNSAKISKPIPVMPDRQELGPFLPWTKEKPAERQLTSTVAKFESLSSRETSPILLSPRIKLQDKVNFMCSALEPSPPAVPIARSPSQSNFVQSKTQIFTPSYPVVNVKPEPPYPIDGPQKNAMSNPVTTYSVDVAATSTIYPNIDALEYDSVVSTPEEQMAVTKVMGSPVQQQAVTVRQKTHRRNDGEDNRNCAAKSLTSMLQRFSSPPSGRGGGHDTAYAKSSLLPPNLPTGKTSPTSPGSPDERFKLRRPSSAESLALSNSSDEIRESEAVTTSRLQIPVSQYRTNSLQDLSPQGSPTPQQPADVASLRKSESCHQLNTLKPKRPQSLVLPDLPAPQRKTPTSLTKTKSSHALSFPKQFEAVINPAAVEMKQRTVEEYLSVKKRTKKEVKTDFVKLDDNLENVDEAFDALFSSVSNSARTQNNEDYFPRGSNQLSKSISASAIQRRKNSSSSITTTTKSSDGGYSKITTERSVFTTAGSTKAASTNKPISPFAKFQQLDRQNSGSSSTPSSPSAGKAPLFTFTDPKLSRSASGVKDRLLQWCQMKTKNYKNIQIENFSTSWSNGLAFCALIHHFRPEAFDYDALSPRERRKNFELAFKVAEDEAGIAPLLDVEDMVMMKKPDWKCVFTYVQSIYCRFKNED